MEAVLFPAFLDRIGNQDLLTLCRVSRYHRRVCSEYLHLRALSVYNRKLPSSEKPVREYIRLITEEGELVKESVIFLHPSEAIFRALSRGDIDMAKYFSQDHFMDALYLSASFFGMSDLMHNILRGHSPSEDIRRLASLFRKDIETDCFEWNEEDLKLLTEMGSHSLLNTYINASNFDLIEDDISWLVDLAVSYGNRGMVRYFALKLRQDPEEEWNEFIQLLTPKDLEDYIRAVDSTTLLRIAAEHHDIHIMKRALKKGGISAETLLFSLRRLNREEVEEIVRFGNTSDEFLRNPKTTSGARRLIEFLEEGDPPDDRRPFFMRDLLEILIILDNLEAVKKIANNVRDDIIRESVFIAESMGREEIASHLECL